MKPDSNGRAAPEERVLHARQAGHDFWRAKVAGKRISHHVPDLAQADGPVDHLLALILEEQTGLHDGVRTCGGLAEEASGRQGLVIWRRAISVSAGSTRQ